MIFWLLLVADSRELLLRNNDRHPLGVHIYPTINVRWGKEIHGAI
jgi:hypothetical protein